MLKRTWWWFQASRSTWTVMPTTAFRLIRRKSSFLCMEMKTQKEPLWNKWQHLPVLPGKIFWHTIFMYTAGLPVLYGVLRENIFPAVVWTICSVHSRHWKVSYRHRTEKVFRFTVSLTMKKWEVPASRGLLLHCFAIRWSASVKQWEKTSPLTEDIWQTALWSPQIMLMPYIQTIQIRRVRPTVRIWMEVLWSNTVPIRNILQTAWPQVSSRKSANGQMYHIRPF